MNAGGFGGLGGGLVLLLSLIRSKKKKNKITE